MNPVTLCIIEEMELEAFRLMEASKTPSGLEGTSMQARTYSTLARRMQVWIWELKNGKTSAVRGMV